MSLEETLAKLKITYLDELPDKILNLKQQFSTQDWKELHTCFHKLKGSGKTFGVPEVSDICKHLEKICELNPNNLTSIFSSAMELLTEVGNHHKTNSPMNLESDPRFLKIAKTSEEETEN